MARKIALHIEDNCIKLVISRGTKVEGWATYNLEEGLVDHGVIIETDKVAAAITELLTLQNVTEKKVSVALSGINSIFRIITLPAVPAKMLPEAVANEASRILPVSMNDVYHSYQVLSSVQKDEFRLFLAAYPQISTDALLETMSKAHLKVETLELAPLALARCINAPKAVAVNAWLTYLDVVVMVDRIPQVIRSVWLPVESSNPAERMPAIKEEIERTITFFNNSFPDNPIDNNTPVLICGDLAREEEPFELGYPVSVALPGLQYEGSFNPAEYIVNLGIALKGSKSRGADDLLSLIDFNALPQGFKAQSFSLTRVLVPVGLGVAAIGLYYGWMLVEDARLEASIAEENLTTVQAANAGLTAEKRVLEAELAAVEGQLPPLQAEAKTLEDKIKAINANTAYFNSNYDSLGGGLVQNNSGLAAVIAVIPNGMLITDVQLSGGGATLTGQATSEALALEYARLLRARPEIAAVVVSSVEMPDSTDDGEDQVVLFVLIVEWANP
jgi:type IV pilus assembly protein PilM